jgi:glucokinase
VNRPRSLYVGVDIGGSTIDAVAIDESENVVARSSRATDADDGDRVLLGAIESVRAVLNEVPGAANDIIGIGVGVPGLVDSAAGSVRLAMNINIGPEGFPIGPKIEAEFGIPTTVENDVRAAALGAYRHWERAERFDVRTVAFLGVGTGISAGLVLDGRLHRGREGRAGEIGHVPVVADGPECRCGLRGCLESVVAGPAIARLWPTSSDTPAEELFRAAAEGDAAARRAALTVATHLASAVHLVSSAYDPDLIVLGGGVGSVGEPLLSAVKACLVESGQRSTLARHIVAPERLVSVPRDLPIGAIGAAAVARTNFGGVGGAEHRSGGGPMP